MEATVVTTKQQLDDAYTVRHQVFVEEQNVPSDLEIDEHEDVATHIVLYNDQQEPIGAGRCRIVDDVVKVERICVMKEARKTGAGKVIMDKIEEVAKQKGMNKLKLNSQTHAEPFYTKLGYDVVSDEFMDAGIPHVTMIKEI